MRGQSSRTSSTMCVERMTVTSRPMEESRFRKRLRSAGSRPAVGSSTMIRRGIGEQRLRDAEALLHAAGVGGERFLADIPEIGLLEQGFDHLLALAGGGDALQDGEVVQHVEGGIFG